MLNYCLRDFTKHRKRFRVNNFCKYGVNNLWYSVLFNSQFKLTIYANIWEIYINTMFFS